MNNKIILREFRNSEISNPIREYSMTVMNDIRINVRVKISSVIGLYFSPHRDVFLGYRLFTNSFYYHFIHNCMDVIRSKIVNLKTKELKNGKSE